MIVTKFKAPNADDMPTKDTLSKVQLDRARAMYLSCKDNLSVRPEQAVCHHAEDQPYNEGIEADETIPKKSVIRFGYASPCNHDYAVVFLKSSKRRERKARMFYWRRMQQKGDRIFEKAHERAK